MKVYITGQSHGIRRPPNGGPWRSFYQALTDRGLVVNDDLRTADAYVAMNHQWRLFRQARRAGIDTPRRILVTWESPPIRATNFRLSTIRRYGGHVGFSPLWPAPFGRQFLPWPQGQCFADSCLLALDDWERRRDSAALVSRNLASAVDGTLYALRREVLAVAPVGLITLTGGGWPTSFLQDVRLGARAFGSALAQGKPPSWHLLRAHIRYAPRGQGHPIEDKNAWLRRFRVALVIENSEDYVSEKLFDAIAAGCVPVYVGPPLQSFGLDPTIAIESPAEAPRILEALQKAIAFQASDVKRMAKAHHDLVRSTLPTWAADTVLGTLGRSIATHLLGT